MAEKPRQPASTTTDRIWREKLNVLLGETRNEGDRAVRVRELQAIVSDIAGQVVADLLTSDEDDPFAQPAVGTTVESFHEGERPPGFYRWQQGETLFPPPRGRGGPALYLTRQRRIGIWLAANADGPKGAYDTRLYLKGATGQVNDFNPFWREIFHEGNLVGALSALADGTIGGGLWEVISNASGTAIRFASGMQVAWRKGMTVTQVAAKSMSVTWTYPAAFNGAPFVTATLPAGNSPSDYTDVFANDIAHIGINTFSSPNDSAVINVRTTTAAASLPATAQVTNVSAFAIGMWV